jgi:hypothetical protein
MRSISTMREVVAVVNRPQDIEDEEAMNFFRWIRGGCRREPGVDGYMQKAPDRVRGHGWNSISWMLMCFLSAAPLLAR